LILDFAWRNLVLLPLKFKISRIYIDNEKTKLGFFSLFCIVHAVFKKKQLSIGFSLFSILIPFILNFNILIQNFILFIFQSLSLKNEKESIETKRPYLDFLGISLTIEI